MRITKKIFTDLAIYMMLLGVAIGVIFPFFCMALGVPEEIVLRPVFFAACVVAGILLAFFNISLARKIVGSRIRLLSQRMKHVEEILINRRQYGSKVNCTPENCLINMDSKDELGESADSFNHLILALAEVLDVQTDHQIYSEMLTANLELDTLANQALHHLIKSTQASGGAILIEQGGEFAVAANIAILDEKKLKQNALLTNVIKTLERQLIQFPQDIALDGVIADFRPRELLIEPIIYKQVLRGVLILASVTPFTANTMENLTFFSQTMSIALNNAITHNQMQQLAALDPLTGVYNRRFGNKRIQEEFGRSVRTGAPLSLLMLDIDHFKIVNDTYGHMVGDKIIVMISKTITGAIREGDVLIRYGGEEFLCVLPGASQHDAGIVAERIRVMIGDTVTRHADQEIRVTVSIGTMTCPHKDISDTDQFIKLTDEAMYTAKENGRNRVVSM